MVRVELQVKSNEEFRKNIGFRHCIHKLLRLEVASSYENYCNQVRKQYYQMINRINELISYKYENIKCSPIQFAVAKARQELYNNMKPLNEYYSLLTTDLVQNKKTNNLVTTDLVQNKNTNNLFDYKYMMNAKTFIETYSCNLWFETDTYINTRDSLVLPNFNLTLLKKEKYNQIDVYDVGVAKYHKFFANGCNVSNSLPSRMTVGQLVECLAAKEGAIAGHFVDGTPFNDYDTRKLPELLEKLGYSQHGTETMYCGLTGRKMDAQIFIGPTYYIRLKHMVDDKVHGRARGPRQALTRQPLEGRSRDGGLKIGEMEKDAMVSHGMGQFLKERMMETSDITKVYVCDDCGLFAAKVIDKDYYSCKACKNTTRISAVVIPHACKLLFQELMAVNILPRIHTEKSVYGYDV